MHHELIQRTQLPNTNISQIRGHRNRSPWLPFTSLIGLAILVAGGFWVTKGISAKLEFLDREVTRLRKIEPSAPVVVREVVHQRISPESTIIDAATQPAVTPVTNTDPMQPESELDRQKKEEEVTARIENLASVYRDAHAKETRDPQWAAWAAKALQEAFSGDEFKSVRVTTDCRATLCRIDASFSESTQSQSVGRALSQLHPWPGVAFAKVDPESHTGYGIFAREGYELPE